MSEDSYSIKEFITISFKEMNEKIESVHEDVKLTKEQTIKTNGRVNKHDWYFKVIWWALGSAWTLVLIGVPLAYRLFSYTLDLKIQGGIKQALIDNVKEIQYEK